MDLIGEIPPAHVWESAGFPDGLGAYLDWLEKKGARELLWTPEPAVLEAVSAALSGRAFALAAVLPNMSLYARDAMASGPTGAVLKRFKALSPFRLAGLALRLVPRAPALLGKRFSAGALLLADAELLRLAGLPVATVALHNSVVDMALAFDCRELFDDFRAWARGRGVQGVFMTNNLGLWASRTEAWGLTGLVAVAPVNAKGYLMQPDRASAEAYCRAHPGLVWAVETGGVPLEGLGLARAAIPWSAYRPETPESRLAAWKKRIESF